ncbi:MAG: glycosyltransferase [Desulfuromonadales bacterium]|nr:MAG: glycosyltransferase [Desulfuromonadales bacterium]
MFSKMNHRKLPTISIVTPSYNQAGYLEATMKSILDQGYPNLEYIIMDGGSTDGSAEIIRKYSDRLTHWESAPDKGQADAIFRGFERATGEILCYVNSDDLLLPGSLERVGSWFQSNPAEEWVVGGSVLIDHEGKPIIRSRRGLPEADLGVKVTFKRLLLHNCGGFHQPASFWRRKAFEEIGGFDRALRFCFDYDLFFRLAKRKPSGRIRSFLAAFRYHPTSKTSTLDSVFHEENETLWRRYGKYAHDDDYINRIASKEKRCDEWRNRLIKLGLYLNILKCPHFFWDK